MTLLEIMIVLALIALVAGTVGMTVIQRFKDGQVRTAQLQVREISGRVQQFMVARNQCPSIDELVSAKYLRSEPRDPWGNAVAIQCPGQHDSDGVDVLSYGPDKKQNTDDDVRSWKL